MVRIKRGRTVIAVVTVLGALMLSAGSAFAFNPQPEPPGMPVSGMEEQHDYLSPDFGEDRENMPGQGFMPPSGIGQAAQLNPQRIANAGPPARGE